MILLLDTHVLLWAAYEPGRLSEAARAAIEDASNQPWFSAASIWEVAIKASLGRRDFTIDAQVLRRALLESGYVELPISGAHAAATASLARVHDDPFDRMLVAQARTEGVSLLTADDSVAAYGPPVRLI